MGARRSASAATSSTPTPWPPSSAAWPPGLLALDVLMVVVGSGDDELERSLVSRSMVKDGRFFAWSGYHEELAHRIEAASDLSLTPSRIEPCGPNRMDSQRYGTLPVVRGTGGLVDTVEQCDPNTGRGTGFIFRDFCEEALDETPVGRCRSSVSPRPAFAACSSPRSRSSKSGTWRQRRTRPWISGPARNAGAERRSVPARGQRAGDDRSRSSAHFSLAATSFPTATVDSSSPYLSSPQYMVTM